MYKQIGKQTTMNKKEYQGLSTDTKPTLTEKNTGSTYYEVDTKNGYVWHIDQWYPV